MSKLEVIVNGRRQSVEIDEILAMRCIDIAIQVQLEQLHWLGWSKRFSTIAILRYVAGLSLKQSVAVFRHVDKLMKE